jgi:hypothetical protein
MAFWVSRFEGAVALTLAGPALALLLLLLRRRAPPTTRDQATPDQARLNSAAAIVCVGCLSVAVLPQMLGRTDTVHALYTVTPAVILLSALLEGALRPDGSYVLLRTGLVVALVAALCVSNWFAVWPPSVTWPGYQRRTTYALDSPRPGFYEPDPNIASARTAVLAFIERSSSPGDAIFVGALRHDRVYMDEPDLYFLANRRPGTRQTQFEPNVVTREDVQREMIAALERNRVRVLVLSSRTDWYHESQQGIMPGSTVLDAYIASHFDVAERHPPYVLYTRRD